MRADLEDEVKDDLKREHKDKMTEEAEEELKDEANGDFIRELQETLDSLTGDVDQEQEGLSDEASEFCFDSDDDDWQTQLKTAVERIIKNTVFGQGARAPRAVRRRCRY